MLRRAESASGNRQGRTLLIDDLLRGAQKVHDKNSGAHDSASLKGPTGWTESMEERRHSSRCGAAWGGVYSVATVHVMRMPRSGDTRMPRARFTKKRGLIVPTA